MPKYIVAKVLGNVVVRRNRGENRKLVTLGQLGKDVFEVEAGSKEKALKKGLDMFPAGFPEKETTIGQFSQTVSVEK